MGPCGPQEGGQSKYTGGLTPHDCWVLLQHPCPQHPVMDSMPLGHGKWCSAQKRPGMRGSWRATGCRENTYSATPEAAE